MNSELPTIFYLHARALGHVHRWCHAQINGFFFDIEEIDELVELDEKERIAIAPGQSPAQWVHPIGSYIIALKVEIASDADATLFKLKWHDHLIKHPIIPRHRKVAA
jgi:hypothetical protein